MLKPPWHTKFFHLLILFLPTQLGFHFWPESSFIFGIRSDYLSPTVYFTDVLFFSLLVTYAYEKILAKEKFKINKTVLVLVLYLLLSSLFVANNHPVAVYKTVKITEMLLFACYVCENRENILKNRFFYIFFSVSLLYSSILAVVQFYFQSSLGGVFWFLGERSVNSSTPGAAIEQVNNNSYLRSYSVFSHPNSLSGFLAVGILVLRCKKSVGYLLTKTLCFVGIFLSFSTVVWFGLGIVFILSFLTKILKRSSILLATILFGLAANIFLNSNFQIYSAGVARRASLFLASWGIFVQNPLVGVGLNNFIGELPKFSPNHEFAWFLQPVHNIFMLTLSEIGLFGFVLLGLIIYSLRPYNHKYFFVWIIILITGSFDHYWITLQQNQLLLSLLIGLSLSPTFSKDFELS